MRVNKRLTAVILSAFAVVMSFGFFAAPMTVFADTTTNATVNCPPDENGCGGETGLPQVNFDSTAVHTVVQLAFGIIGAVAVIFMIIAGIRLVTSGGDPDALGNARRTIIYSAIGLGIAVSAELVVTFVLDKI